MNKRQLIKYLKSLDLNLPTEVNINITGLLNGHLVRFNGVVQITVFKKGGKQLSGFTIVILFWAMITITAPLTTASSMNGMMLMSATTDAGSKFGVPYLIMKTRS